MSVNFRCKDDTWQNFGMKENQLYIPRTQDPFMIFFLGNLSLRPSCYNCHAKRYRRADMTIADFWGIEDVAPEIDDEKGISLIIARTGRGQELFDSIKGELIWKEVSYEDGVKNNASEYSSVNRPLQRDQFFMDAYSMSFRRLCNKYIYGPLWKRTGRKIKRALRYIFNMGGTGRNEK